MVDGDQHGIGQAHFPVGDYQLCYRTLSLLAHNFVQCIKFYIFNVNEIEVKYRYSKFKGAIVSRFG